MNPKGHTPHQLTLAAGILVVLAGILCVGSGVALLAWRILEPGDAVILPPGAIATPQNTPTPGVLSVPVALPPLPENAAELVILPVSDLPTLAPTGAVPETAAPSLTATRSATPTETPTPPPSRTPTPTDTATCTVTLTATHTPTLFFAPTHTKTPRATPTAEPSHTPSASPTRTPSQTTTPTFTPTYTVTAPPVAAVAMVPERIVIEKIALDAPVVPVGQHPIWIGGQIYSQWDVPDEHAAGWHQNSAPLGKSGNTVLNGHHNVNGAVFYYLILLKPGDMITLQSGARRYLYVIAQTMMLAEEGQSLATRQTNARWILPTDDERVTLITCWPYEASTHRWVVIALSTNALDQLTGIP